MRHALAYGLSGSRRARCASGSSRVNADLLGPAGGEEEIVDEGTIRDRYLVGVLAPRGTQSDPVEDDDLALGR